MTRQLPAFTESHIRFQMDDLPSGVYMLRASVGNWSENRIFTLIR